MKPFVGYPGGKSRAAKNIIDKVSCHFDKQQYVEIFAGGFSLGLSILDVWKPTIHINEYDPDMYSLWYMVLNRPEEMCDLVRAANVSPESFYKLREKLLCKRPFRVCEIAERAIDKLVIHKLSFSNMGEMSGSPVGGKSQTGKWKFDCRWNVGSICRAILKTHTYVKGARLTRKSFEKLVPHIKEDSLVYLDPPYVVAGGKCYKHSFTKEQHILLAEMLRDAKFTWFLTYDCDDLILDLYDWAFISDLNFKYFMSSAYRSNKDMKVGNELFISNFKVV